MGQLKVIKKDILIINIIFYLFLSLAFVFLQYAYRNHLSPFSLVYLKKSPELFWYIGLAVVGASAIIWKHHSWSLRAYLFCTILVSFKVVEGLFIEFNKIIVIALFCYLVIAYFFYQLFSYYLSLASLNQNFTPHDLFEPMLLKIPCKIKAKENEIGGYLTNWDEEGCFILLSQRHELKGKVQLEVYFKDRIFQQEGEVVAHSLDSSGLGLKFGRTQKVLNIFNWDEFIELVEELGFRPERLR